MKTKQNLVLTCLSFVIFFLAACYITYPLIFHLGDFVTGYGDELSYAWIYQWAIHSILSGNVLNLFNTNIFYPYQIALSNSDPNLTSAVLSIVPYLFIKEPIVVVNFTVLTSIIFVGFSVYLLSFYLTKDFWASLFSGILVIFSPAFLSFYMHIQMLAIVGVPLALLSFLLFIEVGKFRYWVASLLFFVLQVYNNFIAGYFILFSYVVIFIFTWIWKKKLVFKAITVKNSLVFLLSLACIIPIMIPYFHVSQEFHYVRDIRDSVHLAIEPEDLLYSSGFSRLQPYLNALPFNQISQNNEFKPGYLGAIFTFFVIFVLWYCTRYFKKIDYVLRSFFTIGLLGIVLSLGPVLHLGRQTVHQPFPIPLPYAFFYYIIPGFQGFRNSARWEMLFILAMAVAIPIVLVKVLKHFDVKKRAYIYLFLIVGCIIEFNYPMHFEKIPSTKNFPLVYSWLATTPKNTVIIEMPVYNWNMPYGVHEFWRMYYSTTNFRRTVNGAGGFTPPPWEKMAYELDATFPSTSSIDKLHSMGIKYLIVHTKEFDQMHADGYKVNNQLIKSSDEVLDTLSHNTSLRFMKKFKDDYVYAF